MPASAMKQWIQRGVVAIRPAAQRAAPGLSRRYDAWRFSVNHLLPIGLGTAVHDLIPEQANEIRGIELDLERQLELLRSFEEYRSLWEVVRKDPMINLGLPEQPEWISNRVLCETPDAEIYASMIARFRPERIVEIGAGFSTRVARATVTTCELPTKIAIVDPEPRADVRAFADEVFLERVENLELEYLAIGPRDLLFIDSSHVLTPGGDIEFLFTRVLPSLPAGALVQVHDIFLPWDYPREFVRRWYTEQYVLQALLAYSSRFEVLVSTHAVCRTHRDAAAELFGERLGVDYFGTSFWFRVTEG
jgi:hypothetical protein